MSPRIAFPAIAFPRDGRFYIYPDEKALEGRHHETGMRLFDSEGRSWIITGVADVGPVESRWARIAQFLDGHPRRRFEAQLAETDPMTFEDAKIRACAAISVYPDDWKDDELFAGESGPGFDEVKMYEYFKYRIKEAGSIAQIVAITDDPYKDATGHYDWDYLLPDATYPVIGIVPDGEIKGYRIAALGRCRDHDLRYLRLVGTLFVDNIGRSWELIWYRDFGTAGSPRRWRRSGQSPMHFLNSTFAERGRVTLDELKALVAAAIDKRPQQWAPAELATLRRRIGEAHDVAGLLDVLDLPDEGAWSRQFYP